MMGRHGEDDSKLSWLTGTVMLQTSFTTVTSSSWSPSTPWTVATTVGRSSGLWKSLWVSTTLASTTSTVRACSRARSDGGRSTGRSHAACAWIYTHMQMLFCCRQRMNPINSYVDWTLIRNMNTLPTPYHPVSSVTVVRSLQPGRWISKSGV